MLLFILCSFASCGISKTTSGFSQGNKTVSATFPRQTLVYFCDTDPSLRQDVIYSLIRNVTDTGIEVANSEDPSDAERVCAGGMLPEAYRKALHDSLGIEGIFTGTFTQRKVEPFLFTRFDLKLIEIPSGRLIWSTKVETNHLAATANTRTIGTKVAEMAVGSLRADLFGKPQRKAK